MAPKLATAFQSCGIPTAPLEAVVFNEDLQKRPFRAPDHAAELRALSTLIQKLAESPETILQSLVEEMLALFNADSAGISLLMTIDGEERFYWPAISGEWKCFIGGGTPRNFGPCGDVLDRNRSFLFRDLERRYDYYEAARPRVEECLLVPFYLEEEAVGTLWIVAHDQTRQFDAEDLRQLESVGRFAATAYRTVNTLKELEQKTQRLEKTDGILRAHVTELETADAQLRTAHDELKRTSTELARSNEDLERFAYVAAHDLKSPLVAIGSLAGLLNRELKGNEDGEVRRCLEFLTGAVSRLTVLIDDVLRYAAIANASEEMETVAASDACESAIANLSAVIDSSNAQIRCAIGSDVRVHVPMTHLVQVFQNLLRNAIHYRDRDAQPIVEVLSKDDGAGHWMFTVEDNGVGIREEDRERIFEPFKRLHGSDRPGSGLGLAICKRVIEQAQGKIGFNSCAGKGTAFFFALPKG